MPMEQVVQHLHQCNHTHHNKRTPHPNHILQQHHPILGYLHAQLAEGRAILPPPQGGHYLIPHRYNPALLPQLPPQEDLLILDLAHKILETIGGLFILIMNSHPLPPSEKCRRSIQAEDLLAQRVLW